MSLQLYLYNEEADLNPFSRKTCIPFIKGEGFHAQIQEPSGGRIAFHCVNAMQNEHVHLVH